MTIRLLALLNATEVGSITCLPLIVFKCFPSELNSCTVLLLQSATEIFPVFLSIAMSKGQSNCPCAFPYDPNECKGQ